MRKIFTITALQLLFIFSLIMTPVSVKAWGNKETHPAINTFAISVFERQLKKNNPYLKNTSLDGRECFGKAWDPGDGTRDTQQNISIKRKKHLRDWIIDGGFSADEPEYPMGLRHFYDPTNPKEPWLTDAYGVGKFLPGGNLPEIDAVTWAIDESDKGDQGIGGQDFISIKQNYSWHDAREYFRRALASDDPENIYYGQAWRAVGEVMHLMADMTVPAHVRNDGHAVDEPLEKNTNKAVVKACAGKPASRSIKYDTSIETLMRALATWTNKNFFSEDTIPIAGETNTANGKPAKVHLLPVIKGHEIKDSYVYYKVDGRQLVLAWIGKTSLLYRFWGMSGKQKYHVYEYTTLFDSPLKVVKSQQSILIPTAIRACAQVLNRFLPRFEIKAEVSQTEDQEDGSNYTIFGEVKQHFHKTCWLHEKKDLKIKNSVYLMINGKEIKIPKRIAGGDFNEFSFEFEAQPKDMVWLRYDLGGYVIESNKVEIEEPKLCKSTFSFTRTGSLEGPFSYGVLAKSAIVFNINGKVSNINEFSLNDKNGVIKLKRKNKHEPVVVSGVISGELPTPTIRRQYRDESCTFTFSNPRFQFDSPNAVLSGNKFKWVAIKADENSYDAEGRSFHVDLVYDSLTVSRYEGPPPLKSRADEFDPRPPRKKVTKKKTEQKITILYFSLYRRPRATGTISHDPNPGALEEMTPSDPCNVEDTL